MFIRMLFGMSIFFLSCPFALFTGCTMTSGQTQAVVNSVDLVGKTLAEVVKIYGNPLSSFDFAGRGSDTNNMMIVRYPDFSLMLENGIVIHRLKKQ